ncbi:alanine racemase [Roseobacteraceae bacterium NS-SX3]
MGYLAGLSQSLRRHGLDAPAVVLDLDRIDHNIAVLQRQADAQLTWRLVAKSLPCLALLDYLRERLPAVGWMTFSEAMLDRLLAAAPGADHLMGKPLPARAAARVLAAHGPAASGVKWLIDTPERLQEYGALAAQTGQPLKLALEVDAGLHRGGFASGETAAACRAAGSLPGITVAGVMGYEAHLAKLPGVLRRRAERAADAALAQAAEAVPGGCVNAGGSLTFARYRAGGAVNDIAFGSVLVKPADFDTAATAEFLPAAFIATPVLKVMPENPVPGLEFLRGFTRHRTALAIHGGHFPAKPVFPEGFRYSPVFGRSSNQEVWIGPRKPLPQAGDAALLWPTQSEAVLNLFGRLTVLRGGKAVDEWETLPN